MQQDPLFTMWRVEGRVVIEVHEKLTPPGCAVELELYDGHGFVPSDGVWPLSDSGRVLAIVVAESA